MKKESEETEVPKYETQVINGTEYKVIWEVLDENGCVVEETISEAWAIGIIEDEGKHGEWDINDRLEVEEMEE